MSSSGKSDDIGKFDKVLKHPDKEEIIKRLLKGDSLKQVEAWLKKKYSGRKRMQISWITLQKFRKEHLNIHGDVLEDLKTAKNTKIRDMNEENVKKLVSESSHYQQMIHEIASNELDASRRLLEMDKLINARLIYFFNLLQSDDGGLREDRVFLEYIREYRAVLESWKKFIEGHADKKIEHNINITYVNEQLNVLKGIVFELLKELDPALVPIFVEKLNKKMAFIEVNNEEYKRLSVINSEEIDEY